MHYLHYQRPEDMYTTSDQRPDKQHEILNNSFSNKLKQLRKKSDQVFEKEK